ncbi:hypothetical protein, partial [Salmonella sp. s55044]|uniref:hypothetical protein n=1 Tax=Salmonella sp. s55044 TaxID=3159677 RepID=UPI00398133AB
QDARELMKDYFIGELVEKDKVKSANVKKVDDSPAATSNDGGAFWNWIVPGIVALGVALAYRYFVAGSSNHE